jgi:hypothetical protein
MLARDKHEQIMRSILVDIYQDEILRTVLAFKGGTCLYMFHKLTRFSTDLDFNYLSKDEFPLERMNQILGKYFINLKLDNKTNTCLWVGNYERGTMYIKVEASKREYPLDTYVILPFYGLQIVTSTKECMFAHKLVAFLDRKEVQNRDAFDIYFMFENNYPIKEDILKLKFGYELKEYAKTTLLHIEQKLDQKHMLHGLGELLGDDQKTWVKSGALVDYLQTKLKLIAEMGYFGTI